jgi:hypothetical protein
MEKKDLLQPENENLKIAFIFGAVLYDELTEERTKPISKEQAETLTDEEIEEIVSDESKLMGKVTFHMANGTKNQYSFHRYSTRRAIFNYNGETNFYVLADWIEKLETDTVKVLENIDVDSHWKN